MQFSLRFGRIGSLTIYFNYTWLFAIVLGLWWLALLWLPDHLPGWQGRWYWLDAVLVLILYLVTLLIYEGIHSLVGRTGPRNAQLYPIGAAQPFRLDRIEPGRGVLAALLAPLFNLVLGGTLVILTSGIAPDGVFTNAIKGLFEPLGWLNLALGVINFIPGIPFDGGWALSMGIYWFNGDRESGMSLARSAGGFAALALVLLGAWRGLTTNSWVDALALVFIGWSANDAGNLSRGRSLLRGTFSELHTSDLMIPVRENDSVQANESVTALVRAFPRFPPGEPIAVLDDDGKLTGVVTLSATEALLQGNWASTPVRSIATPLEEAHALPPGASLNDAIALFEERPVDQDEELSIPIVEGNKLVGSISPSRLNTFVGVAEQFGVEETLNREATASGGLLSMLGRVLPAIILITFLAILGNIALRTNPAEIRGSTDVNTEAPITFKNFTPPDDAIVGLGPVTISVEAAGPSEITTATLTLDGQPLDAVISGESPLTKTLTASIPGATLGLHDITVKASLESGRSKSEDWQFRVSATGQPEGEGTPQPTPQPTTPPIAPPEFSGFKPVLGAQVLAGATAVRVGVVVTSTQPISQATVLLDGQELAAQVAPVAGNSNLYSISATAPKVEAGTHRLRVEVSVGGVSGATEWTFNAITPDDSNVYFEQTGHFISEPFLSYWQNNGGLAIFGYPISDRIVETAQDTGEQYIAQYFERARFEIHPSIGGTLLLGRLGALIHQPDPAVDPIDGQQYVPETGHNLGGDFLAYWNANGGLAVFGYPISEVVTETNAADGKDYQVQYFERNRFELHPDADPASRVQLGLLGVEIYKQIYGTGTP